MLECMSSLDCYAACSGTAIPLDRRMPSPSSQPGDIEVARTATSQPISSLPVTSRPIVVI